MSSTCAPLIGSTREPPTSLQELALLFVRLGTTAFGGPAAHIAMMEEEVVRRRRWLTRERFLDLLGATNLIPGPNSTEMAIHIGHHEAGWAGLIVAGACFIIPLAAGAVAVAMHEITNCASHRGFGLAAWAGPSGSITHIATSVAAAVTLARPSA
jgi:chromate transport protein ChrA